MAANTSGCLNNPQGVNSRGILAAVCLSLGCNTPVQKEDIKQNEQAGRSNLQKLCWLLLLGTLVAMLYNLIPSRLCAH